MDAWLHGCMAAWLPACMAACLHGCLAACLHGPCSHAFSAWMHGCMTLPMVVSIVTTPGGSGGEIVVRKVSNKFGWWRWICSPCTGYEIFNQHRFPALFAWFLPSLLILYCDNQPYTQKGLIGESPISPFWVWFWPNNIYWTKWWR